MINEIGQLGMRNILLIFFTLVHTVASGQGSDPLQSPAVSVEDHRLELFVDSLRRKVLADTVRFNPRDLVFTSIGRRNTNGYSNLYIVNGSFLYKLDIVENSAVLQFANQLLDRRIIKQISYMSGTEASKRFGRNAWNGLVVITTVDNARFEPCVAGLVLRSNNSGDNFTTRKENEVLIQE